MPNTAILIIVALAAVIILICIIAGVCKSKKKKSPPAVKREASKPSAVNTATSLKNIDYAPIVEMTRIITDNDAQTVEKMRLLVRDYPAFVAAHQDWCDSAAKKSGSNDKHILIMNFFSLWLSGFSVGRGIEKNPTGKFGCCITGGEAPKNIIRMFEEIDRSLNYGIDAGSVNIAGFDGAAKTITALSQYLADKRYTLISLEADSGFYLFIVPTKDYDRVIQNSAKVDFKIYRQIST